MILLHYLILRVEKKLSNEAGSLNYVGDVNITSITRKLVITIDKDKYTISAVILP